MFEVVIIWGGELHSHKADSFLEAKEWIDCYYGVREQLQSVRVWFGRVCLSKVL